MTKLHALRLKPGDDLRKSLEQWAKDNNISAAVIVGLVGSLKQVSMRLAGKKQSETFEGYYEICAATGVLSTQGLHVHFILADAQGRVIGGHLRNGCIVHTTCEIVLQTDSELVLLREYDDQTETYELMVKK